MTKIPSTHIFVFLQSCPRTKQSITNKDRGDHAACELLLLKGQVLPGVDLTGMRWRAMPMAAAEGAVVEAAAEDGGGRTATRSHEGHMVRVVGGFMCM